MRSFETPKRRLQGIAVGSFVLLMAFVLAACGGESTSSVNADGVAISGGFPFEASTGVTDTNEVPPINVIDLSDGTVVNLASAVPDERTTVFWFWAPH